MKPNELFIYPDSQMVAFTWIYSDQGKPHASLQGDEKALLAWLDDNLSEPVRTVMILPVEAALHTVVTIPRKQRRFLSRSLPFVLEAQTAQDIDELHIVPDSRQTEDQVVAYAIPHQTMGHVLRLQDHPQVQLDTVVLDSQILATQGMDTVRLAWQGDRILVSRRDAGLACRRQDIAIFLERLIPEGERVSVNHYDVMVAPEHEASAESLLAELVQSGQASADAQVTRAGWLPLLLDLWREQGTLTNLLTGPYEQADGLTYWSRHWPVAAWAGSLAVVAGLLFFIADLRQTEARAEAVWAATESLYTEVMPGDFRFDRRTVRQTMESMLDRHEVSSNGSSGFLNIMSEIDTAMERQDVTLEEFRYTGSRQQIQLQVTADSTDSLEAFRSRLEAGSLQVTYSAGSVSGGFRGNYRIQRTGD